jgi:murein DD-endopeptidase MepM/ murein hydrolase activator NlpD
MRLTRVGFVAATSAAWLSLIAPAAAAAAAPASLQPAGPGIVCPVAGESTFDDSYGWARSGGRRHQGIDMVAERGTPVIAVRSGDVFFKSTRLGGNSAWLTTPDGARFFYAHLDGWEGESRLVVAGDVIGYVGHTGNAGGDHLHFETHFSGSPEDPFPATTSACAPDDEPEHEPPIVPTSGPIRVI